MDNGTVGRTFVGPTRHQGLVAWPKIVPNPDPEPQFDLNLVQVITKAI